MLDIIDIKKLESKLKTYEICFEQNNNSRNDLIKQLTNVELQYDKLKELWTKKPVKWVEQMYQIFLGGNK